MRAAPEALDQAVNRDQIDGFDIMGTGQHQIQRIIVASLARNDGFERLVTELDRSIPGAHLDRPMFVSVVDYLRTTG